MKEIQFFNLQPQNIKLDSTHSAKSLLLFLKTSGSPKVQKQEKSKNYETLKNNNKKIIIKDLTCIVSGN
jgi:hypothetical protein